MISDHNRQDFQAQELEEIQAPKPIEEVKVDLPMASEEGANSSGTKESGVQNIEIPQVDPPLRYEEVWKSFERRKNQEVVAKRGANPSQILRNPSHYDKQWGLDPKPSSLRFLHFVHENVKKQKEGIKRPVGTKDKKNGFINRLDQFFLTHTQNQRLSIVKKAVESFEKIGSEIEVQQLFVKINERKKWLEMVMIASNQLNEMDKEDLESEQEEDEKKTVSENTDRTRMYKSLLRTLNIYELKYSQAIGSTDSDSNQDQNQNTYRSIGKLIEVLQKSDEVHRALNKRRQIQALKDVLRGDQLVSSEGLKIAIQNMRKRVLRLIDQKREDDLMKVEKEFFDQDNNLVKKIPTVTPLPLSIVAATVGEADSISAQTKAKIDVITNMCMNAGRAKFLKNDPEIDAMFEMEKDPMPSQLFIAATSHAKEKYLQYWKEDPSHEPVNLGYQGENFSNLPQYRSKPGNQVPEMQSYFPHFQFPDGRAKYFSRRNVRDRDASDQQPKQPNQSQGKMSGNGAPTANIGNANTWSHSFIQSSARDVLIEQLQRSVREEQAGRGKDEYQREDRFEQRKDLVKLNKNAIVTVGGVRLDKIVMKTGALSKSSKKTSKMLRGAEMRRGTFTTVGEKLNPLDEQALRKLMTAVFKRETPKMIKFYTRYKTEKEAFLKRAALACAKEYRKKVIKRGKALKEVTQRAKKLAKEVQSFWRRQDRELVDAKRKKEKQLRELRRQEEERREAELQKKRFQFLLRESTVYADFMARKMGVRTNQKDKSHQPAEEDAKEEEVSIEEISIQGQLEDAEEEARVQREVSAIIEKQQQHVAAFDNPNMGHSSGVVMAPSIFNGTLKEYQLKGLRWLVNLWEQGINGILADEMGLGKTVQAIALLAHICESRAAEIDQDDQGDQGQGPFLVIAPTTTLHSWLQELRKFCPSLAVMPYWGSQAQRKTFRQYFRTKWLGRLDSSFHVLVTSYQLAVSDQKYLGRIKWKYLVLDEAQAIKNFSSVRWRTLLNYDSRNRLLLTGTPIQNSMAELWALLHFIMPALFQNHDDFQEWFSRDIEAHSRKESALDRAQLDKLHAVLKPFMLRRVKKDVEHQLAPKQEKDLLCDMSRRQKALYRLLRAKLPLSEMFKLADSKIKLQNLMNLIMQFRKVCNHPELFERHVGVSPFLFTHPFVQRTRHSHNASASFNYGHFNFVIRPLLTSPIAPTLPRLIVEDMSLPSLLSNELPVTPHKPMKMYQVLKICLKMTLFESEEPNGPTYVDSVAFLCGLTTYEFEYLVKQCCPSERRYFIRQKLKLFHSQCLWTTFSDTGVISNRYQVLGFKPLYREMRINSLFDILSSDRLSLYQEKQLFLLLRLTILKNSRFSYHPRALAAPPFPLSNTSALQARILFYFVNNPFLKLTLFGSTFRPSSSPHICGQVGKISPALSHVRLPFQVPTPSEVDLFARKGYVSLQKTENIRGVLDYLYNEQEEGLQNYLSPIGLPKSWAQFELPDMNRLIQDCGKLKLLDGLLRELKAEGRRTLIFCQMTKMLDILEQFLTWRKYTYLRMDGSSVVSDRRDMVDEFQQNDQIFAFLLSTRAGGLGVTLTAADTVIFYDSDWNPTMDAQATDRVHRIGQTKEVRVYRLMTRGTVQEKILKRAQQKQAVQSTVYAGGALKGEIFRPSQYIGLLADDDDQLGGSS